MKRIVAVFELNSTLRERNPANESTPLIHSS
jgi:hypothetical protein